MKILIVAPHPFYQERGTPIAVRLVAETLCELGHEVDLLVYHEGTDISASGLRLFRAGRPPGVGAVPIGISWQKLVCDVWLVRRMISLTRARDYDVIHATEEAVFPAALLSSVLKKKLVYDMDSSLSDQTTTKWKVFRPLRPLLERIENRVVRRADLILPVCEDLAERVRPAARDGAVHVLPDVPVGGSAADASVDDLRAVVRAGSVLCLYVGNLEAYQGIDLLLDGLAACREQRVELIVIGGEALHIEASRSRATSLGIEGRVHFLGPRPIDQLPSYLKQADILVSPRATGQNTPMKVYSYMNAGRAILATRIRSHTQVLDDESAVLVEPTPAGLAAGLERLAADPGVRGRLGSAAREKVERDYSITAYRTRLRTAYESLKDSSAS
jgi:glycosyltransferase involved in cell wall biosynthesis